MDLEKYNIEFFVWLQLRISKKTYSSQFSKGLLIVHSCCYCMLLVASFPRTNLEDRGEAVVDLAARRRPGFLLLQIGAPGEYNFQQWDSLHEEANRIDTLRSHRLAMVVHHLSYFTTECSHLQTIMIFIME